MKKKGKSKVKNKELENSITGKFMEAVQGLGHNAELLKKEIAKAGKSVSQKITSALKIAEKQKAKAEGALTKTVKKAAKKKDNPKSDQSKVNAKADKVVSTVTKAVSGKTPIVSSRSVPKPAVPTIDKSLTTPAEKAVVNEAAATPVKRTRAPRKKVESTAPKTDTNKVPVNEAPAPVKRKRAPNKSKTESAADENPVSEATGSAVL